MQDLDIDALEALMELDGPHSPVQIEVESLIDEEVVLDLDIEGQSIWRDYNYDENISVYYDEDMDDLYIGPNPDFVPKN